MQHGKRRLCVFLFYSIGGFFDSHHKVGLLVLFCHDITDIWLELAKASHYLSSRKGNRECPRWETVANGCFVMFFLSW
jgi:hypothetical protein